jgi:hypothetical protein
MAESLDERNSIQSALQDIENTLVSASTKLAQVQLDAMDDAEISDAAANAMDALSPIIESIQSAESEYQMETNRLANEGELE